MIINHYMVFHAKNISSYLTSDKVRPSFLVLEIY